ncbi:hypothetical protein VT50_0233725 [Streptomyces antioxidans]|uniref:Uncharacterized protein n=1 Tax=Streptomyces antioxidans TaxID=1507734 RepID=A0A1V4CVN1_9ACTN|nr:hypothetical protein [Streptomyces antioxidans]OPF71659.1 hypothetical protein VT50_0233725 [Streptomyces antioxidans]
MTPRCDDGPEHIGPEREPDDPLAVILRPPSDYLGPPPGRYEAVRRTAARRRLLRTAAGVGVSCAVAVLIALPLRSASPEPPARPTVPLAPPPTTGRTAPPLPSAPTGPSVSPRPSTPSESSGQRRTRGPRQTVRPQDGAKAPVRGRSAAPDSPTRAVPSERGDRVPTPGNTRRP